jgi:hypothetical protein
MFATRRWFQTELRVHHFKAEITMTTDGQNGQRDCLFLGGKLSLATIFHFSFYKYSSVDVVIACVYSHTVSSRRTNPIPDSYPKRRYSPASKNQTSESTNP